MSAALASPLVSVVVVACDSGDLLVQCVERVLASQASCELLLVDNASRDGAVDAVLSRFGSDPRMRVLRNDSNVGFGRACNQAARLAAGAELLFLNPDCLIEIDALARLRHAVSSDPAIGLLGADVVDAAGRPEAAARRREPNLRRAAASALGLRRYGAPDGVARAPVAVADALEDVEAVSGALMYLPRRVFEQLGGFDEGYFLHCEDLDLCHRVRAIGLRVAVLTSVRAVHFKGASSQTRPLFVLFHKHRGMWRYFRKFDPLARQPLLAPLVYVALWTRFILLAPAAMWRALRSRRARIQ